MADNMTSAVPGRATRQRRAVAALLSETDEFRSAQDLHRLLSERGEAVGLTTVYRTLQSMADAGDIDVMRPPGGEHLYRRCGQNQHHHHHLVCRNCGKAVEVDGPPAERWVDKVAEEHGFTQLSHTFDIFGLCGECAGCRS
ncbi:Fur family transcriptional regulator [Fodinicola acaciae]|uniref:Fur family transcriptional regulator n=1 Tax=Fodinicola acaciae TaxID=2681555 RepID=UPI001FE743E7|nr:transcriptional repressor [Fodinicola acaciae]